MNNQENQNNPVDFYRPDKETIAQTLHDLIGQPLMALKFAVGTLGEPTEKTRPVIDEMQELIRGMQIEVRKLLVGLQTIETETDLKTALLDTLNKVHRDTTLKVRFEHSKLADGLDVPVEVIQAVVETTGKALDEIAAHADATRAVVKVWNTGNTINLRISDNGRQLWMNGIYHTVLSAQGRMLIDCAAKKGTMISVKFPVKKG